MTFGLSSSSPGDMSSMSLKPTTAVMALLKSCAMPLAISPSARRRSCCTICCWLSSSWTSSRWSPGSLRDAEPGVELVGIENEI